jgi:hypothetical protein
MSYTDIRSILLYEEVYFLPFGICRNNILKQFVEVGFEGGTRLFLPPLVMPSLVTLL